MQPSYPEDNREKFIRSYLTEEELTRIVAEARKAADFAVPTYSQFYVGACILTQEGDYVYGCNIENISYSQTVHAEGCCISKAVSAKKKNFKAVAVYAKSANFDAFVPPCGECRQFLSEFANFLPIILVHESGALMFEMLHELLPLSMVLGGSAPQKDQPAGSKYDSLVSLANKWILKDTHPQTRNEMRQLLRDWQFDEILELVKEKVQFNENGVLAGKFRAGFGSVNHLNLQEIFEAIAVSDGGKGKYYVAHDGDSVSVSLAHRVVASLNAHGKGVKLVKDAGSVKDEGEHYVVSVSHKGGDVEVKVVDGKGAALSKDVLKSVYENRDKQLSLKFLHEVYDYKTNKLIKEEGFNA